MKKILFAALLTLMAVVPATALAAGEPAGAWVNGWWEGDFVHPGGIEYIHAFILLSDAVMNGGVYEYTLRKGIEYSVCGLFLRTITQSAAAVSFSTSKFSGGSPCTELDGATFTFTKSGTAAVRVRIVDKAGRYQEKILNKK